MSVDDDKPLDRPRRVTAQAVADAAGVSRSAVSRAFTQGAYVDAEKRRRIKEVAAQLGYQPNALAASLKGGPSHLVAIFVGDMRSAQDSEFVAELVRELNALNKWPILIDGGDDRARAAFDDVMRYPLDALILRGGSMEAVVVAEATKFGVPVILSGRTMPDLAIDSVLCRNDAGARMAAEVLLAKGRTRFGFLGGPATLSSSTERRSGVLEALETAGLQLVAETQCDYTVQGGFSEARAMLSEHRLDALICANDASAIGALSAAQDQGIAVPEAMSILGFDDIHMASWPMFDLSTIRNPNAACVHAITDLLERRLADPSRKSETVFVEPEFVARGTH